MPIKVSSYIKNLPGKRTSRKLLAFISDDWGDIRISSSKQLKQLRKLGIPVDESPHTLYETLTSPEDFERLFEVLTSVEDFKGKPACLTSFALMANPDIEKIKANGKKKYEYITIDQSIKELYGDKGWKMWLKGIENEIFDVQLHGREHFSSVRWMNLLQEEHELTKKCLEYDFSHIQIPINGKPHILAACYTENDIQVKKLDKIVRDAGRIYLKLFGKNPLIFNPPNAILSKTLYPTLYSIGVRGVVTGPIRYEPDQKGILYRKFHYSGQRIGFKEGIITHFLSNAAFEPSSFSNIDHLNNALQQIEAAFIMGKPALVNTHRVNYVKGRGNPKVDASLRLLKTLLTSVKNRWPEVEFIGVSKLLNK